jgi:anti-sigma regulatory factor (Ser/Thr protein kinase)
MSRPTRPSRPWQRRRRAATVPPGGSVATTFRLPSEVGGEREAIRRLQEILAGVEVEQARVDNLSTAVGEAVMNAMEHAHAYDSSLEVEVELMVAPDRISVAITDLGGGDGFLDRADEPDLEAKLRGEQTPRGWGLFLMRSLVDRVHETGDDDRHTVTLELRLGGDASLVG